ncbi:HDIG domain-containing metalloprotein [Candidatus Synechococcus spongiarum]|uniref:HDIG domain-containing metalloprotein n=1 Tax=Candidatus Synechococcus spongiarum TaxID=431041 RepID=UPI00046F0CE0|nr:HDIG domain-containing metalloprotein [Candidatus Synechococcus spongiarum]
MAVVLAALLVGVLSSWPLLREPVLAVGAIAEQDYRAPASAQVVDRAARNAKRSDLGLRTVVHGIDRQQNLLLQEALEQSLRGLRTDDLAVPPIDLSREQLEDQQQLREEDRAAWEQEVLNAQRRMLAQGLVASVSEQTLRSAARQQLSGLPEPQKQVGAKLLVRSLLGQTNLRPDSSQTRQLTEKLLNQNAEMIQVREGDLIVSRGALINSRQFDLLDHFNFVPRRLRLRDWAWRFGEAVLGSWLVAQVARRWNPRLQPQHGLVLLLTMALVQGVKLWLRATVSPLAVLVPPTFLLAEVTGAGAALGWLAVASALWPFPMDNIGLLRVLVAFTVAVGAALIAGRQRSRAQLLQTATLLTVGAMVLQMLAFRVGEQMGLSAGFLNSGELMGEGLLMGGVLLLGLNLVPALENTCGLVSRSRLLELADLQRPLLRRLSREAPGTFEHTLMICGLAEEGARAIGADVDLVRTGSLYHDIGKLHRPQWFIENQADGPNPHELLNDPWASAKVLQAHVDEGLRMARRAHLPQSVCDFIPEHQGTMRMEYFWHAARKKSSTALEKDFRYRGPTPRSREAGIQMLADGCEAALRSLPPEVSENEAHATVCRIVDSRIRDGQLRQSGLSHAELELVAAAFVKVWKRMRHHRIPYPIVPKDIITR